MYKLVKFRTNTGFDLNGWEIWVEGLWEKFVERAKNIEYPHTIPLFAVNDIVTTLTFTSFEDLMSCYKVQDISLEDSIILEEYLIDTVDDSYEHIRYQGFMPSFIWE